MKKLRWDAKVSKTDLLEAIGFVRTRAGLRYKGTKLEPEVVILAAHDGLSFRTMQMAIDIPAEGNWPSPIAANGPTLRKLAPKLSGPAITLVYEDRKLILNATAIPAREL